MDEHELQLWFVLNRYQYEPELKKLLNDGYIVIAEDYVGTGIAWGALFFGWFFFKPTLAQIIAILVISLVMHRAANWIAFKAKLKTVPW
jgi:hypothetical protein